MLVIFAQVKMPSLTKNQKEKVNGEETLQEERLIFMDVSFQIFVQTTPNSSNGNLVICNVASCWLYTEIM